MALRWTKDDIAMVPFDQHVNSVNFWWWFESRLKIEFSNLWKCPKQPARQLTLPQEIRVCCWRLCSDRPSTAAPSNLPNGIAHDFTLFICEVFSISPWNNQRCLQWTADTGMPWGPADDGQRWLKLAEVNVSPCIQGYPLEPWRGSKLRKHHDGAWGVM